MKYKFITSVPNLTVGVKPPDLDMNNHRVMGGAVECKFVNGVFETDEESVAKALMANPHFKHPSVRRGFYLASEAQQDAPKQDAPAAKVEPVKEEKAAQQDAPKQDAPSKEQQEKDAAAYRKKVAKKYLKKDLVDMANSMDVAVDGRSSEDTIIEALMDAGAEFDV